VLATTFFKLAPGTAGARIVAANFWLNARNRALGWAAGSIAAASVVAVERFIARECGRFNHDGSHSRWCIIALPKQVIKAQLAIINTNANRTQVRYLSPTVLFSSAGAVFVLLRLAEAIIEPVPYGNQTGP